MRILFAGVRPGFPQRLNGAAVSTHLLAGSLAVNGAAVHVLCGRAADGADALRPGSCRYTIDAARDPVAALPGTVTAFSPDVAVLSTRASVDFAAHLARHRIPFVIYQRDLNFELLRAVRAAAADAFLGAFACSRFIAREMRARVGLEAVVLPNIFPRERYEVSPHGDLVTFINPVPAKGVETALALAARHRDLPFLFVEGWKLPQRQKIALLRRAAESENIRWQSGVTDMRSVYARTRVLLVPSRWEEAWGRVATEAQLSGIPVIASDHGGLRESVGDGGVLLPPDDIDGWSDALSRVMTDEDVWTDLSARARERSHRDELNPNRIVAAFVCQLHAWMKAQLPVR